MKRNIKNWKMEVKECGFCHNFFSIPLWRKAKTCSIKCAGKFRKPIGMKGKKHSLETKKKMSKMKKGIIPINILRGDLTGKNHPLWIKDRTQLKKYVGNEERRSPAYKFWRKQVWLRDNFTCKIANPDCSGRLEAHHILGFSHYPELKYDINNGITLCHFHHPRVREEEKRLIPTFKELVSVSNTPIWQMK